MKILQTGMDIGNFHETCYCTTYDFEWMIRHPAFFILSEKIIFPTNILNTIKSEFLPDMPYLAKVNKLILDILDSNGLIEEVSVEKHFESNIGEKAQDFLHSSIIEASKDSTEIQFHETKEGEHLEYEIAKNQFCLPMLFTSFLGILLARKLKAIPTMEPAFFSALSTLFSRLGSSKGEMPLFPVTEIIELPGNFAIHPFAFQIHGEHKCEDCLNKEKCEKEFLRETEKSLLEFLKIRNYDEVNQFQRVLDETISQKSLDFKQINQELRQRKVNFELLKKKHFPKIERAASILTMISIPIGISGVAASSLATSLTGAILAGSSQVSKEYMKWIESKNSWVNLISPD